MRSMISDPNTLFLLYFFICRNYVEEGMPGLTIGDTLPNLEVETTTHGRIRLHDFVGDSYTIIFSHPGDFTTVCTTEMWMMATYAPKFDDRSVKLLGLSCDDVKSHRDWINDVEAYAGGCKVTYPIAADPEGQVIRQLNMVLPSRGLHVVGPDKKIKLGMLYPATTGRNMDKVVRVVDALLLASKIPGDSVVILPSVSDQEANRMFPQGFHIVDLPF